MESTAATAGLCVYMRGGGGGGGEDLKHVLVWLR